MILLAIETSTDVGSVAVVHDGTIVRELVCRTPMRLLTWLSPAISEILRDCKLDLKQIDAIATGIGPGSFTGVRLELATARTLAQIRKIPLYGIPSLDALAAAELPYSGTIVSSLDARRGELFAAFYEASDDRLNRIGSYACVSKEKFDDEVEKHPTPRVAHSTVRAGFTGRLAYARRTESSGDPHAVKPLYIRASQAELERKKISCEITSLVEADIPEIMAIEKATWKTHWPESAFMNELNTNRLAHYFTARHEGKVVGYAGVWIVIDEAHITTLAVHADYRRRKIGEQLLMRLLAASFANGARRATLEVRETNLAAQELYKKFGFTVAGTRKNYYQEDHENAVVMWSGNLR